MRQRDIAGFVIIIIAFLVMVSLQEQIQTKTALAQTTTAATTTAPKSTTTANTFSMNGAISSLVMGMSPRTKTVDMTTVQKFILSGDWSINVDNGKLTNFAANFYTGPANGVTSNHTHQISNFRVDNSNNTHIIQLSPSKSVSISGISDVGTNGKKAWNNVHTTIVISNGRTIAISLADKDTQAHFMGQQILGIVKRLNITYNNNQTYNKHHNLDNINTVTFLYNPSAGGITCNNSTILNSGVEYPFQDKTTLNCYANAHSGYKFYAWENTTKVNASESVHQLFSNNSNIKFTVTDDKIFNIDFVEEGPFELLTTYLLYKIPNYPYILFFLLLLIFFYSLSIVFGHFVSRIPSFRGWLFFRRCVQNLKKVKQEYIHSRDKDRFLKMMRKSRIKIRNAYEKGLLSDFQYTVLNEEISDNEKMP